MTPTTPNRLHAGIAEQEVMMKITQVVTVGVPVADQDRAVEFYTRMLGLEVVREFPVGEGKRWIEVGPRGAATTIALIPAGTPIGPRLTTPDAEAIHAELRTRGADMDPEILRLGHGVPPMFSLRDPDGNVLTIVEGTR
jgi:catechol 2,3-dioxygenase-like lactoylglutathione lyase family enzyme